MGGGSGGDLSNIFGSKILAKSYFLGSMKTAGFFGSRKKQMDFFGLQKTGLTNKGVFWGMLKNVVIFLDRQIQKLWFFGV